MKNVVLLVILLLTSAMASEATLDAVRQSYEAMKQSLKDVKPSELTLEQADQLSMLTTRLEAAGIKDRKEDIFVKPVQKTQAADEAVTLDAVRQSYEAMKQSLSGVKPSDLTLEQADQLSVLSTRLEAAGIKDRNSDLFDSAVQQSVAKTQSESKVQSVKKEEKKEDAEDEDEDEDEVEEDDEDEEEGEEDEITDAEVMGYYTKMRKVLSTLTPSELSEFQQAKLQSITDKMEAMGLKKANEDVWMQAGAVVEDEPESEDEYKEYMKQADAPMKAEEALSQESAMIESDPESKNAENVETNDAMYSQYMESYKSAKVEQVLPSDEKTQSKDVLSNTQEELDAIRKQIGISDAEVAQVLTAPEKEELSFESQLLDDVKKIRERTNKALKDIDVRGSAKLEFNDIESVDNVLSFKTENKVVDAAAKELNELKDAVGIKDSELASALSLAMSSEKPAYTAFRYGKVDNKVILDAHKTLSDLREQVGVSDEEVAQTLLAVDEAEALEEAVEYTPFRYGKVDNKVILDAHKTLENYKKQAGLSDEEVAKTLSTVDEAAALSEPAAEELKVSSEAQAQDVLKQKYLSLQKILKNVKPEDLTPAQTMSLNRINSKLEQLGVSTQ